MRNYRSLSRAYNSYEEVYLPTYTVGVCLNVRRCGNGLKPPFKVDLGDGYCVTCFDRGRANKRINNV